MTCTGIYNFDDVSVIQYRRTTQCTTIIITVIDTCFWLVGLNKSQQTIGVHSSNQISQHIRSSRSPKKQHSKKQHCGRNPIRRLPKSDFTRFSKEGGGPADIAEGKSDQVKNISYDGHFAQYMCKSIRHMRHVRERERYRSLDMNRY